MCYKIYILNDYDIYAYICQVHMMSYDVILMQEEHQGYMDCNPYMDKQLHQL